MRAADIAKLVPAMTDARQNLISPEETSDRVITMDELFSYQQTVFRICLGYSRNYAEAEDLTQETYLKAYQKLSGLRAPSLAKEWLFRIAKNTCLDRFKKNRTRGILLQRLAHEADIPADPAAEERLDERIGLLKAALRLLPKKLRTVFILREYGRLTYEELASTLRLNKGTVMSRLSRARQKIAAAIQEKTHERD